MGKAIQGVLALIAVLLLDRLCVSRDAADAPFPYTRTGEGLVAGMLQPPWTVWALVALAVLATAALFIWIQRRPVAAGVAIGGGTAAGGLLGLALLGALSTPYCVVQLGHPVSLFELAVLFGTLLLTASQTWELARVPHWPQVPLLRPLVPLPDFSVFPRGTDNLRIDVRLSPAFCTVAERLIAGLLSREMIRDANGRPPAAPDKALFAEFRDAYTALLKEAARKARKSRSLNDMALMQVSVIKFLQQATGAAFEERLGQLRAKLQGSEERRNPVKLVYYDQVFAVAKGRRTIEQRVRRSLFQHILRVERSRGVELRRSLFGHNWAIPGETLFNPLLAAHDPGDPLLLMRDYVLLGKRGDERRTLQRFVQAVEGLSRDIEPSPEAAGGAEYLWLSDPDWRSCAEGLDWPDGRGSTREPGWIDVPDNMERLLDPHFVQHALEACEDTEERQRLRRHRRYQRHAIARLLHHSRREGLLIQIVAAYDMVEPFNQYYHTVNPLLIYQFLIGGPERTSALRQLRRATGPDRGLLNLRALQKLARDVREHARRNGEQYLLRFVRDLFTYRRDLRNFCVFHAAMEQVRLLRDESELKLSRANRCLHEFLQPDEAPPVRERVSAHIIIKADLRGSTTLTAQMLDRDLNPATHFDRHFFTPVNEILEAFGAEKVFVEGDAVIASILEYDHASEESAVGRACAVARRLLGVVRASNAALRKQSLPQLQVGVGIAYQPDAPSYLFEGNQPIMISPAIGRADRLSSSSWRLREDGAPEGNACHVAVFELDASHPMHGEKGETDLRYNVDGAELETPAFERLREELSLVPVALELPGEVLAGRVSDRQGTPHTIVLRRAPVRSYGSDGPGADIGRWFVEVVTEAALIEQVERELKQGSPAGAVY